MPPKLAFILGTRPEIIKLSPLIRACETKDIPSITIHTGQHYSEELDAVFFRDLNLDTPDYNLDVGSHRHGRQTGEMLVEIERILLDEKPELTVVQGDTNSTLAGGIVASKLDCELVHVEAGLRSFDREMPEEVNRILVDHVADMLFAPTVESSKQLRQEGVSADRIEVTGNTIVDAVYDHETLALEKSEILSEIGLESGEFALLTAHRAANVDDPDRFANLLRGVGQFARRTDKEVVYPVHPRATDRIGTFDLDVPPQIRLIEPLSFLDFLRLESAASIVFTDSGGVQEETCVLGTPCVTLRDNTERPETVTVGSNVLAGTDPEVIVEAGLEMLETESEWDPPFGDGNATKRILTHLGIEKESAIEGVLE